MSTEGTAMGDEVLYEIIVHTGRVAERLGELLARFQPQGEKCALCGVVPPVGTRHFHDAAMPCGRTVEALEDLGRYLREQAGVRAVH